MKYDLFISDYDGTLGDPNGIDEGTVAAIKEYVKKGGKFVVCSGRVFSSIRSVCNRYDISDVIVSFQGARINERVSGRALFKAGIETDLAVKALKAVAETDATPTVLGEDYVYYTVPSTYTEVNAKSKLIRLKKVDNLINGLISGEISALKINVMCEGKVRVDEFIKRYSEGFKGELLVNSGGPNLAEFISPKCSKGAAVRFLSEYYSIPYEKIIAVGDSTNDIELVSGTWHGVAVGSAKEELKKYAKEITVDYKNHPVKFLLEKYCL